MGVDSNLYTLLERDDHNGCISFPDDRALYSQIPGFRNQYGMSLDELIPYADDIGRTRLFVARVISNGVRMEFVDLGSLEDFQESFD